MDRIQDRVAYPKSLPKGKDLRGCCCGGTRQPDSIELRYQDENIWLTQRLMAELYNVEVPTVNEHIAKIYADNELTEEETIRNFRIVQTEGSMSA